MVGGGAMGVFVKRSVRVGLVDGTVGRLVGTYVLKSIIVDVDR